MSSALEHRLVPRVLIILAGIWGAISTAHALPCASHTVPEPIQHRWNLSGGQTGPLGCPTAEPTIVSSGTLQQFEHGQVAFSPNQGSAMTVTLYQSGADLVFEWGDTYPFHYDKFLLRWDKNGSNVGQWDDPQGFGSSGLWHVPVPSAGLYSVVVEGCENETFGGSSCDQHWTVPVSVQYLPPDVPVRASACTIPASGPIYSRWNALNLDAGRLGCPVAAAHPVAGTSATAQEFQHGQIVLDPDRGSEFTITAYQAEDDVVVEWGPTDPFSYDAFNLLWSKDGVAAPQVEVDPVQTPEEPENPAHNLYGAFNRGVYPIRGVGPGTYTASIEGCDKGTFGSTCRQQWSTPVTVQVSLHRPYYTSCNLQKVTFHQGLPAQIIDIVIDHWSRLVGSNGPLLGCPTRWQKTPDHPEAVTLLCDYGAIVWTPNQGADMSVAVWQEVHRGSNGQTDGYTLWFDAGDSYPFSYDKFLLLANGAQSEISSNDGNKISGVGISVLNSGLSGATVYPLGATLNLSLEGCDSHTVGAATCHQGWTVPVNWQVLPMASFVAPDAVIAATSDPRYAFYTFQTAIPASTTRTAADPLLRSRGMSAASWLGCSKTLGAIFKDEQDFGAGVLAKLEMVAGNNPHCENFHKLSSPPVRERPWLVVDEVNAALRFQLVQSRSGTTDPEPCLRTGDYDVVLPRLIAALMGFGFALDSDVRDHIVNGLLNLRGPIDPEDDHWTCAEVSIPETENHLNNMESSRYLANQLLYEETGDPLFDNETNGMNDYWLARLKQYLQDDFLEYNSKTYQSYTDLALQNLADYANDRRVKTAAQAVLDYIAAKYAVSSIGLRRNAPFRRHPNDYNNVPSSLGDHDLLGMNAESQNGRFALYTGLYGIQTQVPVTGGLNKFHQSYASEMVLAYAGHYRPAASIRDFMYRQNSLDPGATGSPNFSRIHHSGIEIYSGRPQYLITAGGIWTESPYLVAGRGKSDDQGAAVITSLIPAGSGLMSDQLIRFTGYHDEDGNDAEHEIGEPSQANLQTCVGPDFACGYNLLIPNIPYLSNPACVVLKAESCAVVTASAPATWTFLNRSDDAQHCVSPAPAGGFFVAIHQSNASGDVPALLEAFPANTGTSFEQFVQGVCDRNATHAFSDPINTYVTTSGAAVTFSYPPPPPGLPPPGSLELTRADLVSIAGSTFGTSNAPMANWPLASGTLLNADGHGKVTFHDPAGSVTLTLDLTDASEPIWSEN